MINKWQPCQALSRSNRLPEGKRYAAYTPSGSKLCGVGRSKFATSTVTVKFIIEMIVEELLVCSTDQCRMLKGLLNMKMR